MATNEAAWLDGAGKQLRVAEAPMPKADSDRVVIRNKAIAINPVDWYGDHSFGSMASKKPLDVIR